jgi:SAM-dependent methyltransferase
MAATSVKTAEKVCPVCASPQLSVFSEIFDVPVHCNLLWRSREAARHCPRGDIRLAFCPNCGFITNLAFESSRLEYTQEYENSLHFSSRFQDYARSLATRLVEKYKLYNKDIIEIGCGKGDFLTLLCDLGGNHGFGFDPSYVNEQFDGEATKNITFIPDFYSERYAHYKGDLICCRHTLEHIQDPKDFLTTVRRAISDRYNTVVFFEVPNVLFTLRDLAIWDIIYEHCSNFSAQSLSYLFALCGFKVSQMTSAFSGQFLCLEARPAEYWEEVPSWPGDDSVQVIRYVKEFAANFEKRVRVWKHKFEQIKREGQRVVVWGAGSKGVTFVNLLQPQNQIEYVVDINPRKQNMLVAGTGQQIVSPEFLRHYQPDMVIVMNPIYLDEIRHILAGLGMAAESLTA